MKHAIHCITRVYVWIVWLYPASFREQFEQELVDLFSELMSDAARKGLPALLVVCLREFWHLPANLLEAHVSSRSGGARSLLPLQLDDHTWHTARWGAVGFGIGFAFINLSRYLMQVHGWTSIGDFFSVWIVGLGTILYGTAGGLGGALLGYGSASGDGVRERTTWHNAWRTGIAGFLALALAWFATTAYIPYIVSLSPSALFQGTIPGAIALLRAPLMGALLAAFMTLARDARSFPLRYILAGAIAFGIGNWATYNITWHLLFGLASLVSDWFGQPNLPLNDVLLHIAGLLIIISEGIVSGALFGLIFGQRRAGNPLQFA